MDNFSISCVCEGRPADFKAGENSFNFDGVYCTHAIEEAFGALLVENLAGDGELVYLRVTVTDGDAKRQLRAKLFLVPVDDDNRPYEVQVALAVEDGATDADRYLVAGCVGREMRACQV